MKLSIFTPTHDSKYLLDAYNSIKDQSFDEWIVLHNNGSKQVDIKDRRVKQARINIQFDSVGTYKRIACDHCTGDILVELDHDDLLMPTAIEEIRKAFEDESIGFVYSNPLSTNIDWSKPQRFNPLHGWQYREVNYDGHILDEPISFEATPASVSKIWYAPDHVKAYRKDIYNKIGGHNPQLKILDDQDLMCRMYQVTKFYHINKPLYIYRIHGENTWLKRNKDIQDGVYPLYDKYIESMALTWAQNNNLRKLDLGGRIDSDKRYESVDLKDADIITDLDKNWPFEDNSIGTVRAFDIFEHLKNPLHAMKELYRILAPGGYAFIQVPSTDGRGAFQDPTHISYWNENSFLYYTNQQWGRYIDTPVKFQAMRLYTTEKNNQQVCWVISHLVSLRNGYRPPGIIQI